MKTIKRRRKEGKTDYLRRLKLLKSEKPRITYRRSNNYIIAQYIYSEDAKDKVKIGVISRELLKKGWPEEFKGSLKSIPASYLTGFLIGKRIKKRGLKSPIFDIGINRNQHKGRVYAFLKGIIDSGLEMNHKESTFPDEEKIKGKNLKKDFSSFFEKIKTNIEKE